MSTDEVFQLNDDVLITSVTKLRQDIRNQILCKETDYILTRPGGRAKSLLIDQEVAEFLQSFRVPITVKHAAEIFLKKRIFEVSEFLENIGEVISGIFSAGFLQKNDSSEMRNTKPIVEHFFDSIKILNCANILDETEIYKCKNKEGQFLALKIAKYENDRKTNVLLKREYHILSISPHPITPIIHKIGIYKNRSYILMEWIEGIDILTAANRIRKSGNGSYPFLLLRDLVVKMLLAYDQLHCSGIVHGDIHPKNCIYSEKGTVHIIDFGLSLTQTITRLDLEFGRPGVPYFYDPTYAESVLEKKISPPADVHSDLYSLAVLSFLLLTGHHYLPFRFNQRHFFKQICLDQMRTFNSIGLPSWSGIEAILTKALSKKENERYPSAKTFADALSAENIVFSSERKADPIQSRIAIARFQRRGLDFDWKIYPPFASVHFGAAGLAYALLKCAERDDDFAPLGDADIWISRAKNAKGPHAFTNDSIGITDKIATIHSLHYGRIGVCICEIMIACSRWDSRIINTCISEIYELAANISEDFDFMSGKPGVLVGCVLILKAIPNDLLIPSKVLIEQTGQLLSQDLIKKLQLSGPISESKLIANYGIAHGWAGLLFSLLRWTQHIKAAPSVILKDYLYEIASIAIYSENGHYWPDTIDNSTKVNPLSASWCRGASGFVHLFGLAYEIYGDSYFLEISISAADYAFAAPQNGASLCCGDAGLAYAQLYMFQLLKDPMYIDRAKALANRAMNVQLQSICSLYKGQLGLNLLTLDLMTPERAKMPFF
jgi:eukaryotic-like serine/threonine-protein kinase